MNRIRHRAVSVVLIALMILSGLGLYIYKYYTEGEAWALYFASANSGSKGSILDRNGVTLAVFDSTRNAYNEDPAVREACYHVTGDYWGRTATGMLSLYSGSFTDYSLTTGTTQSKPVSLNLSIDSALSKTAYEAMEGRDGAVMLLNYKTGEVLVMVSTPSTDPVDGDAVLKDGTFINKCLSASFVPGSVFKLVTAAAAIENIDPERQSFYCDGYYTVAGIDINCTDEHYTQSFNEAMANSCNSAFAQIAIRVGQNTMIDYVTRYGFLSNHTLDKITTAAGNYPTEFVGDPELAWSGIGQSTDLVNPYTLLRFVAAIANEGVLVEPRLVLSTSPTEQSQLMRPDTARELASMMAFNVSSHYEPEYNFPGLSSLCAKTGTAELGDGTSHSWFTGFLSDPSHPYAFVVLVERGGGGLSSAGAVANTLLQAAVNR